MGDMKKWSVTYTKHIKQKRKVYQDGFLELQSRSHKVILYDECEKVLDSRFVNKDDNIKSGETLAFDSYLVDIGDSHGDNKPVVSSTNCLKDKKLTGTSESFQSPKIDRKLNLVKDKARLRNLSPSQKIIREFKTNEMTKYGSSPGCSDMTKSSRIEWQVLYTTQITQKAKKYHDGFLQLLTCGSQGRQAMLFDATRRFLDGRFLKKDEVIRSGESVAFDGHLVDVGECQGDHKPLMDLNFQGGNWKGKIDLAGDHIHSKTRFPVEWEAMYTTQLTQKTKTYSSGILKLVNCGSNQMQVIFLTEGGTILSRRYLQSSESVRTGSKLQLQNYLVELGEPRASPEGQFQNHACRGNATDSFAGHSGVDIIKLSRRVPVKKPALDEEPQKEASPGEHLNSNMISSIYKDDISGLRVSKKPVRAAQEILSILKKPPMAQKEVSEMESQCAEGFHSDMKYQIEQQSGKDFHHEGNKIGDLIEENTTMYRYSNALSESKAVSEVLSAEIAQSGDGEFQNTSSCFSLGSGCVLKTMVDIDATKTSGTSPDPPTAEPKVLVAMGLDLKGQQVIASVMQDLSTEVLESGHCTEPVSWEEDPTGAISAASSGHNTRLLSEEVDPRNVPQPCADGKQIDAKRDSVHIVGTVNSNDSSAQDFCHDDKKILEQDLTKMKAHDLPSYDLGF